MYFNYGDINFFEWGNLVQTISDNEYDILVCRPYSDADGVYQFAKCCIDISDSWIDRRAVMYFIGMSEDNFDPIQYALGCIDYYGALEFSTVFWECSERDTIQSVLNEYKDGGLIGKDVSFK